MSAQGQAEDTPLMKQYWDLRSKAEGAILLFRMGDFYELFGDDAVEASRILEITLTSRDKNKPNPTPMCGVPHHSVQSYIQKLLRFGKKVAIGEQMEDPSAPTAEGKGGAKIVRREIVRIFTPGVQFDYEGNDANYIACVVSQGGAKEDQWLAALLDASTGEVRISETLEGEALVAELSGLPVRHILKVQSKGDWQALPLGGLANVLTEELPLNYLSLELARDLLKSHYEVGNLAFAGMALENNDLAIFALGAVLRYTLRTQQQERLAHLRLPTPLRAPKSMVLGPRTTQHLDLLPSNGANGSDTTPSLFDFINKTRTSLGARQLRSWLLSPLKELSEIQTRSHAVQELTQLPESSLRALTSKLAEVYDLERIMGRVNAKLANPRDTLALGRSLATLEEIAGLCSGWTSELNKKLVGDIRSCSTRLNELAVRIVKTQKDDAPLVSRDAGIFEIGTSPDLDRLISISQDGQRWLVELETREREKTGIPSLKVRYNRVFGYYIEVTQTHLKNVPAHYQRKQTMVGAERFFTEELKKFEDEIVNSSVRQKALELELFNQLLSDIQALTGPIMQAASLLGQLDALVSLSALGRESGWVFPEIDSSQEMNIQGGRHPLVDQAMRGQFVPNHLALSPSTRLSLIITGPNMGGKSTVMRQTALIIILGQLGAPVPALSARWGVVSSLFTRIGAHDAIARGQSTFMVEMSELAHILHHADERSFIVLDEIGRGTSTYDGISVAWATLEWICNKTKARTLFATHYHELTQLAGKLPACANAHMAVESGARSKASLRFLYELRDGATNDSFGIHVAQLAGLPKVVTARAWKILEDLENGVTHGTPQLSLFDRPVVSTAAEAHAEEREEEEVQSAASDPIGLFLKDKLSALQVNEMSPLQALNTLAELKTKMTEIAREST